MLVIRIMKDFSEATGARTPEDGDYSGREFREKLLEPKYLEAEKSGKKLLVDLDGTEGYATSFLEEAFGGLARLYDPASVLHVVQIKSDDEPYLVEDIQSYIRDARQ